MIKVVVDRQVAVRGAHAGQDPLARIVGQRPLVLPEEVAGHGVDGLDDVARIRHVQDAVIDQGSALLASACAERARPLQAQIADVAAVDLVERTAAPAVQGAAPHRPVAGIRRPQHRIGNGNEYALSLRAQCWRCEDARGRGQSREERSTT